MSISDRTPKRKPPGLEERKEASYDYEDETNCFVFRKTKIGLYTPEGVRVDKRFKVEHKPNPRNEPYRKLSGVGPYSRLMFHLADLTDALYAGVDVWWVEGEADVMAAVAAYGGLALGDQDRRRTFTTHHSGVALARPQSLKYFTRAIIGEDPTPAQKALGLRGGGSKSRINFVLDRDEAGAFIAWEHAVALVSKRWGGIPSNRIGFYKPRVAKRKADLTDHIEAGYGLEDLELIPESEWPVIKATAEKYKETSNHGGFGSNQVGSALGAYGSGTWMIDGYENGGWTKEAWAESVRVGSASKQGNR